MLTIDKTHAEACVSAHDLFKALKITNTTYAKWAETWLPSAKADRDYYTGGDKKTLRGAAYTDYFLPLQFAKKLCENRKKKEAVVLTSFLDGLLQSEISASQMPSTPIVADSKQSVLTNLQNIMDLVLKAQRVRASLDAWEEELEAQLARLYAERTPLIERATIQLGIAA